MLVQLYGVLQVYVKLRNIYNCEQKVVHSDTSYHIPNISGYGDFINLRTVADQIGLIWIPDSRLRLYEDDLEIYSDSLNFLT